MPTLPTLTISDVFTPATAAQWLSTFLSNAGVVGLTTTSWQSGGMVRTITTVLANVQSVQDVIVSLMAQGGFLDFAATGSVTFTNPITGQVTTMFVTPDPSIPSQWPTPGVPPLPGWLDILADSQFNVQRPQPTFASGVLTLTNTTQQYGSFPAGTFHVANTTTGATYSNTTALTIAAGTIGTPVNTTAQFQADVIGSGSNAAASQITTLVTSLIGVTCTNATPWTGTNATSNSALVTLCRLKQQALSPNGPKGAYQFEALNAFSILQGIISALNPSSTAAQTPLTAPIAQASVTLDTTTGIVTTTVANKNGAVTGIIQAPITGCTGINVSVVLTVASTTGIVAGSLINVAGVGGNLAANGYFIVGASGFDTTHVPLLALDGVTAIVGTGNYTSGGVLEGADLGLVDLLIQSNVVPNAVTAVVQSASPQNVTVGGTVYVPAAFGTSILSAINNALVTYFATIPVGGFTTGVVTPNTIPIEGVIGAINAAATTGAGTYIRDLVLTLNGGTSDVAVSVSNIPILQYAGGSVQAAFTVVTF